MGKPNKKPKSKGARPGTIKTPIDKHGHSSNDMQISWRFSMLELVKPFGWHELELAKLLQIHKKLGDLESKTWNELLVKEFKHYHPVAKERLSPEARQRLEELNQEDVDELITLRLSSTERVWGIRNDAVLKVLWWDPNHLVCPSPKKHT